MNQALKATFISASACMLSALAVAQAESDQELYADLNGRVIENIFIEPQDVFDTRLEEESGLIFELANRFHIITRSSTIRPQLIFESGETFSAQKIEESERLLRRNAYLFDAKITPVEKQNGGVDLLVTTRDNWTFFPEFSFSRTGGESETAIGIEEQNLFGTGSRLNIRRENDEERRSSVFEYSDSNLGDSWVQLNVAFSDLSDGESKLLRIQQPFFSLDTQQAGGTTFYSDNRIESLFSRGERSVRYREDQDSFSAFLGVSNGLVDGWTRRWSVGYSSNDLNFEEVEEEGLLQLAPDGRRLYYPFVQYQKIQDKFVKAENLNQIGRTEDVFLGQNYSTTVGYASDAIGSDRNAWILRATYGQGYGSPSTHLALVSSSLATRIEAGVLRDAELKAGVRYFYRQGEKRVFYAAAKIVAGKNRELDNPNSLGGDTGLRGYALHYLNADTTALVTIEQRFYTDYYPFHLFRIGGAIFFDAARGWGEDSTGFSTEKVLANVGFGLRIGSMRSSSNRIFHVDIATPIGADRSVDSFQFRVSAMRSF